MTPTSVQLVGIELDVLEMDVEDLVLELVEWA